MRVGLVARADNTGLGNQTWEFYRHIKPAKTMVVDISSLNGNRQYPERYPDGQFINGFPNGGDIDVFLEGLDMIFVAESPYNYLLYQRARERGIKIAVQYNYEFFDWFTYPEYPLPDLLIAPSMWHYDDVEQWAKQRGIRHHYLHCPVNRDVLPYRRISQAKHFIHMEGKSAALDRNGTEIVRRTNKLLPSELQIKILAQSDGAGIEKYWNMYDEGDVMVLPRRYGGNCLPLNEALSVGMPVIMPDITPNDQLLPKEWLVPAVLVDQFAPRTTIDVFGVLPVELAQRVNWFAHLSPAEMIAHNEKANQIASSISWDVLRPQYLNLFTELCYGTRA